MSKIIDGTRIFDTARGAKAYATREGMVQAVVYSVPDGYTALGINWGFPGSPAGMNMAKNATVVARKTDNGVWVED